MQVRQHPWWLTRGTAAQINPAFGLFFAVLFTVWQLTVNVDGQQEWKECADIAGLRLPTGYFFGASSATGDLSGRKQRFSDVCSFTEQQ